MNSITSQLDSFSELNPSKYGVLKSLLITQGDNTVGVYEQRISLIMVKAVDDNSSLLHIDFYGVTNLSISHSESSVIQLCLNIIEGIEVPGVGSTFFVRDVELDHVISFGCHEFKAFIAK